MEPYTISNEMEQIILNKGLIQYLVAMRETIIAEQNQEWLLTNMDRDLKSFFYYHLPCVETTIQTDNRIPWTASSKSYKCSECGSLVPEKLIATAYLIRGY